jgi:pimeloyl-ACP methyl ester carboxylesterase
MINLPVYHFQGRDGAELVYRETGEGRPLILIHGYFSTATENWVRYGHAAKIASRGHRVIMPDLRAHGDSAKPHDPGAYPPDVLADDGFALIEQLGIDNYDLCGYSLGGRTAVRMLVRGATPGCAIIAGMGLEPIVDATGFGAHFRHILNNIGTFEHGSLEWKVESFLKSIGGDPIALLHILDSPADTPRKTLAMIGMPTLVLMGSEDNDHGSAEALAAALPNSRYAVVPGNHMSAVIKPALGAAIADFLGSCPQV